MRQERYKKEDEDVIKRGEKWTGTATAPASHLNTEAGSCIVAQRGIRGVDNPDYTRL